MAEKTTALQSAKDLFDPTENMEGVIPRLPQIKIAHQAQVFKMPDGSSVKEIEGVIVDSNRVNAYWKKDFSEIGVGTAPDCFSYNGVFPADEVVDKIHPDCSTCPMNQFGSKGKGKACANKRRVHILTESDEYPQRLTIPPTSLGKWDEYMVSLQNKDHYATIITKFGLSIATNKEGIEYSAVEFERLGIIEDAEALISINQMRKTFKPDMQQQDITSDEYKSADDEPADAGSTEGKKEAF